MSTNRRAHQCAKLGCDREAKWGSRVLLLTYGESRIRQMLTLTTQYLVCDDHKQARVETLLSPKHRHEIAKFVMAQNWTMPDWRTAHVDFFPVDHRQIDAALHEAALEAQAGEEPEGYLH